MLAGTLQATDSYTYGNDDWKDLLTGYNDKTIVYDGIGNPTRVGVRDADGEWSSWQGYRWQGRQLESVSINGSTSSGEEYDVELYYYQYNDEGIRIEKMVSGYATIQYLLNGTQIVGENINDEILLIYVYNEAGSVIGLKYRTGSYAEGVYDCFFFEKNLQGDIVAIYNESGNKIGGYNYDAWGNIVTLYTTAGATTLEEEIVETYNPFRYRGYYYDIETGFYYVSSRYYDPEIGRWINADGELSDVGGDILGYNLFAYCFNNPVNMDDPTGNWPKWLSGALNVVGGALQVAAGAALGATVGWTGFGAVAAGFLIVNGTATAAQGVGQIVNHVTNSNVMREDNIVRTGVQEVGRAIGGDTGAKIAGGAYDVAVVAANLYAGKVGLQQAGKLPIKVNINNVVNILWMNLLQSDQQMVLYSNTVVPFLNLVMVRFMRRNLGTDYIKLPMGIIVSQR